MYNVYYNKQAPGNITESPNTQLGIAQSPQLNNNVIQSQSLGFAAAGAVVLPAVNRVIDISLNTSGNIQTKIAIDRGRSILGGILKYGAIVALANPATAIGAGILELGLNAYERDIDQQVAVIDNEYNRQKQGIAVKSFTGGGARFD